MASAVTLNQGFDLQDEEDGATRFFPRDSQCPRFADALAAEDGDATRAWGHAELRAAIRLWDDSSEEPSATTSVTQGELEELRKQLNLEQDGKVSVAPAAASAGQQTEPASPVVGASPPRRRTVVTALAGVAALTSMGLGVVAHQTGYLSRFEAPRFEVPQLELPQFEVPQFEVPQVDVRQLLSAVGKAQATLHAAYDKLLSGALELGDKTLPPSPPEPSPDSVSSLTAPTK